MRNADADDGLYAVSRGIRQSHANLLPMKRRRLRSLPAAASEERGTALFAVIPIAILMMSVMVAFVGTAVETSKNNITDLDTFRARVAAKNTAAIAVADLWADFNSSSDPDGGAASFKAFLDQKGMLDSRLQDASPTRLDLKSSLLLKKNKRGHDAMQEVAIDRAEIFRVDTEQAVSLVVEVDTTASPLEGEKKSRERHGSVREIFTISSLGSDGADFGLLAEEASCFFCHATVDSAERVYNSSPNLAGTFAPVKAGILGNLGLRTDAASQVAGMILSSGEVHDATGGAIGSWNSYDVEAIGANSEGEIESIMEDAFGTPLLSTIRPFDGSRSDANLFANIGPDTTGAPALPSEIPPVIADDGGIDVATGEARPELGGNRVVDDSEFSMTLATASGSLSGGKISVIAQGQSVATASEVTAMRSGMNNSLSSATDGNVYLRGTEDDPILLDGPIAIDGDVIISGYVKGSGKLTVRGNVFVASDLVYADGEAGAQRSFGRADDGTENLLTLAAGGNIVVGDYFRANDATTDQPGISGDREGAFNATLQQISIFNRSEWARTQPEVPGPDSEWTQIGTETVEYPEVITETYYEWVPDGQSTVEIPVGQAMRGLTPFENPFLSQAEPASFRRSHLSEQSEEGSGGQWVLRTREVTTGRMLTREEPIYGWSNLVPNPSYEAGYRPRYYNIGEGQAVPIHNKGGHFDPTSGAWVGDPPSGNTWSTDLLTIADPEDGSDSILFDSEGESIASVLPVNPTGSWITPEFLRATIVDELQSKQLEDDRTFKVDAILHTNNSILGFVPGNSSKHGTTAAYTNGRARINGSLIGTHVGLHATDNLTLNYDRRGASSMDSGTGRVELRRTFSAPVIR